MKISWKNRSSSVYRRGCRSSRYRKFLIELLESRHLLSADSFGDFRWLPSILEAKEGPMSNLDTSLAMVYREYTDFVRHGQVGDFQPTAKMLQVFEDKIAVDLVSQAEPVRDSFGDPQAKDVVALGTEQLALDILELGGQIEGRSGPIVSAMIPIEVLPQISQLASLRFATATVAVTNVGLVTSQGDRAMRSKDARGISENDGAGTMVPRRSRLE